MPLFEDAAFRALQGGLDAAWLKQQVTSHNIANVETPGFKAKRVEFSQILQAEGEKAGSVRRAVVTEDDTPSARPDGNNVQLEKEELELWKAYTEYAAMTSRMSGKLSTLRYVINNTGK
ncbi:flagellar basal body rod protein FlgB [Clostridium sp. AN503]|uniref:flagellar basal body rod protein FlgB n=1 Tax=Clostridium sp. AN503 TaxID=3160598 RepID=UPI0034582B39